MNYVKGQGKTPTLQLSLNRKEKTKKIAWKPFYQANIGVIEEVRLYLNI